MNGCVPHIANQKGPKCRKLPLPIFLSHKFTQTSSTRHAIFLSTKSQLRNPNLLKAILITKFLLKFLHRKHYGTKTPKTSNGCFTQSYSYFPGLLTAFFSEFFKMFRCCFFTCKRALNEWEIEEIPCYGDPLSQKFHKGHIRKVLFDKQTHLSTRLPA